MPMLYINVFTILDVSSMVIGEVTIVDEKISTLNDKMTLLMGHEYPLVPINNYKPRTRICKMIGSS